MKRFFILAGVITILALALRSYGVTRWSLNNDEIAEVRWASQSFGRMMQEVRNDLVHPPIDYMLQHVLWRAGVPEWQRRVPSVLFGTATAALLIFLGWQWFSPGAGLVAGFLLAVAPIHIRYSQEVRPYAFAVFLLVAALVALEQYARTSKRVWAVSWFVLVLLAGGTLYFAGMTAGVVSIVRIFMSRNDSLHALWRRLPLIFLGWVVLYAPWLGIILQVVRRNPIVAREKLTGAWWLYRLQAFGTGDVPYTPVSLGSWFFWGAVAVGIVVSLRQRMLRVATLWFVGCLILSVIVLQLRPHYPSPRYLMPAVIGAFILAGASVATLWQWRVARPLAVAIVVLFVGYAAVTLDRYYSGTRSDWRGIAQFVYDRVKPGETVILANPWVVRNFGFYWQTFPKKETVFVERFESSHRDFVGPAWIVTGQCQIRPVLFPVGMMLESPMTEYSQVRYLRPGQRLSMTEEICPE
jgi:mannosyltransferase